MRSASMRPALLLAAAFCLHSSLHTAASITPDCGPSPCRRPPPLVLPERLVGAGTLPCESTVVRVRRPNRRT